MARASRFNVLYGVPYIKYTSYRTKEDAQEVVKQLRKYGEKAFSIRTYDGFTVYHRDEYTDIKWKEEHQEK